MRVAILTGNAQAGDAIGNQIAEKLHFFIERGDEALVFTESGARLHPAMRPYSRVTPGNQLGLAHRAFLASADLILVEFGHAYESLHWLPMLEGGKARILFDYHGVTPTAFWDQHQREGMRRALELRGLVWCADTAIVHSDFTRQELLDATGFPAARCACLGHAIDASRFSQHTPRPPREWPVPANRHVMLFVGRIAPNKRPPLVIEALARVRQRFEHIHAVFIGDMSDVYALEAERCRRRALELGVGDRIHLMGRVSEDDLIAAYHTADVLVMPSVHEGFCIPLVEAMASGLPVVAARAGALPETAADAGLLFRPDDADDLARQVCRLMEGERHRDGNDAPREPSLRQIMRQRGFRRAATFERARWRQDFASIVEKVMHEPARARQKRLVISHGQAPVMAHAGQNRLLLPVIVRNAGTQVLAAEGPARVTLRPSVARSAKSETADELPDTNARKAESSVLPQIVLPGQSVATTVAIHVPPKFGVYEIGFEAVWAEAHIDMSCEGGASKLVVQNAESSQAGRQEVLAGVASALEAADRLRQLPDDYLDVSEGWQSRWVRWTKAKLLGNFKRAYVDVLSRQQSAFNQRVLAVLTCLSAYCTRLERPAGTAKAATERERRSEDLVEHLLEELAECRRVCGELEARLARLEQEQRPSQSAPERWQSQ